MKLRWKLFLILLVFSLTPLVAVTAVSEFGRLNLSQTLAETASQNLSRVVREELLQTAQAYPDELGKNMAGAEATLLLAAESVKNALTQTPGGAGRTYLAQDFDRAETAPPDLAESPGYYRQATHGNQPLPVSFGSPAFLLRHGLAPAQAETDMKRLAALAPAFKQALGRTPLHLFRLTVTLDNGLTMVYPGQQAPSEDYTPMQNRRRLIGGVGPTLFWTSAFRDEATGQAVLSCLMAFTLPDPSRRRGLLALDLQLNAVLDEIRVAPPFSKAARLFLAAQVQDPETFQPGLNLLAEQGHDASPAEKDADQTWIRAATPNTLDPLFGDLRRKSAGVLRLPFQGREALWVHSAPVHGHILLAVLPESAIAAQAAQTGRTIRDTIRRERGLTLIVVLLVLLAVALAALAGSRASVAMFTDLMSAAKRLTGGDFSARMDKRFQDERDMVCDCFNDMVPALEQYLQLKQIMGLAQEVQQNLLPRESPEYPGFDISGTSLYCDETGGDYYDFFDVGTNRFAVVVGDVSGHGIPSALLMATARAFVRLRASIPSSTAAGIIGDINYHFSQDTALTGQFMTLFYAEIDHRQKTVEWVRAGHEPALLYDPATDTFEELIGPGPALGLQPAFEYGGVTRKLAPHQILVFGTDGIWEARNEADEMLGKEALREVVRAYQSEPAKEIVAAVIERVSTFQGSRAQEDDITLVVVKVEGD